MILTTPLGIASGNTTYAANNHGVVVSSSTNAMTVIAPDASLYKTLTSGGTGADPTWTQQPTAPQQMFNLGFTTSIASSAITVSLKQADGSTAPATGAGAVRLGFRSSTITSGAHTERAITSALTFTISSTTTLGVVASTNTNIYWYLIDSDGAGTMKLGASTLAYDQSALQTAVAEKASVTCTSASPCVVTESAHNRLNGDAITLTGTPPTGFSTGTIYYLVNKAANTYQLSATPGGTAINSSSTGTTVVVHTADGRLVSDAIYVAMPIRYIGKSIVSLATPGTWTAPSEADPPSDVVRTDRPTPTRQILTASSGTYTKPSGCIAINVTVVGGGGGGGGVASTAAQSAAAGGGGGGGCSIKLYTTPAATYAYTVGQTANGGTAGANNGTAGNNSTFAGQTANGGGAGPGSAATATFPSVPAGVGGAGGTASGGDVNLTGGGGTSGIVLTQLAAIGGGGGASVGQYGGAGGRSPQPNGPGVIGGTGGGGSGGVDVNGGGTQAGGNGTAGVVIVEEFY